MDNLQESLNKDRLGEFGDDFYEQLMKLHEGLSEEESHALNARLVLLMANQIGDRNTLENLLAYAGDIGVNAEEKKV